jgi:deoxyxylulose-5-phosphate synthase
LSGECVQAAKGKKSDVIILNQLKPLPETLIETLLSYKKLYFIEETPENGGISQEILATLCKVGYNGAVHTKNVAEGFIPHAPLDYTLNQFGLTAGQIAVFVVISRVGQKSDRPGQTILPAAIYPQGK